MAIRFARRYAPELALLLLGALVRVSMMKTFPPPNGYDFVDHWGYIDWIAKHGTLPDIGLNYDAYQAPLYYVIGSLLERAGAGPAGVRAMTIVFSIARLCLLWAALEAFLPGRRRARLLALALAVLLPTAVHLDAMISNEALLGLISLATLIAMPRLMRADSSWRAPVVVGLLCGVALLVKVSATVLLVALVIAFATLALQAGPDRFSILRRAARTMAIVFGLTAAVSGWFFVRNQMRYGKPMPFSYDSIAKAEQEPIEKIPYLDRRTAGFFVGGSTAIFEKPYYPTAESNEEARFWPVMIASTFLDYYGYYFAPDPAPGHTGVDVSRGAISQRAFKLSRVSFVAGIVIAVITVVTLLICLLRLGRAGDARFVLLLVPVLAVAGQIHFATKFPENDMGPIKGAYLQFAAGPLFAMFGLGVDWLWRRSRLGKVLALLAGAAMLATAGYVLYCRAVPLVRHA